MEGRERNQLHLDYDCAVLCRQLPVRLIAVHTGRDVSQTGCLLNRQRRRGRDQIRLGGEGRALYVWVVCRLSVCGEIKLETRQKKNVSVNNFCHFSIN